MSKIEIQKRFKIIERRVQHLADRVSDLNRKVTNSKLSDLFAEHEQLVYAFRVAR